MSVHRSHVLTGVFSSPLVPLDVPAPVAGQIPLVDLRSEQGCQQPSYTSLSGQRSLVTSGGVARGRDSSKPAPSFTHSLHRCILKRLGCSFPGSVSFESLIEARTGEGGGGGTSAIL